jgi:Secretion system C-terminal sorting domain
MGGPDCVARATLACEQLARTTFTQTALPLDIRRILRVHLIRLRHSKLCHTLHQSRGEIVMSAILRVTILTAVCMALLASAALCQTTVYNNFGPDHDGWDYNYGLGWSVAGDSVDPQFGVEQAMAFESTADGTLTDVWVAFWYVPMSAMPDTVTIKLTLNPNGLPPVEADVLEEWMLTDFESWTQWNPPIHLVGNGSSELLAGDSYWLWAVAEETTWTGWCMNVDPGFLCPHTLRRENENWLPVGNETASAFRVDVDDTPALNPTVELIPFNAPIQIPANGGRFGYRALVENTGLTSVTFDAWTLAVLPNGNLYGPIDLYRNRVFPAGHSVNLVLTQNVPSNVAPGTYTFRACVGDYPWTVFNQDEFTFEKLAGGGVSTIDNWASSGWDFADAGSSDVAVTTDHRLASVYPNPFNPTTTVSVSMPTSSDLNVSVVNALGQEVAVLASGQHAVGRHTFTFDGSGLASGIYFVQVTVPGRATEMKKIMLMR